MTTQVKPLYIPGDARAAAVELLRAELGSRDALPYVAGVEVGTHLAPAVVPPFVLVAIDSNAVTYPVLQQVTHRVTCYAATDDKAHDLAQLAHAIMLSSSGPVIVNSLPATGPLDGIDITGLPFYTFTVLSRVRTNVEVTP